MLLRPSQHEVEPDVAEMTVEHRTVRGPAGRLFGKVHNERRLDAEHRIGIDVGIARDENMRRDRRVTFGADDDVHMGGSVGMPTELVQHASHRASERDWIGHRLDGPEVVAAVFSGAKLPA